MSTTDAHAPCPYCGRPNEAHSGPPGAVPKDGDIGVCWGCQQPAVFTVVLGKLALRLPTEEEAAEIAANDQLRAMIAAMHESYRPTEAIELMGWQE